MLERSLWDGKGRIDLVMKEVQTSHQGFGTKSNWPVPSLLDQPVLGTTNAGTVGQHHIRGLHQPSEQHK